MNDEVEMQGFTIAVNPIYVQQMIGHLGEHLYKAFFIDQFSAFVDYIGIKDLYGGREAAVNYSIRSILNLVNNQQVDINKLNDLNSTINMFVPDVYTNFALTLTNLVNDHRVENILVSDIDAEGNLVIAITMER